MSLFRSIPSASLTVRVLFAVALAVTASVLLPTRAMAASVTLRPSKDNTIYGNGNANLSNGAGEYLFVGSSGNTGGARILRSLIAFNLAGQVPTGATVNSVTLTLGINTPLSSN